MIFKKGTKLYSILHFKCPRCHEGDFFLKQRKLNLSNITKIHDKCSECNLKYMMEPSFFYGAMYVAYGVSVGLAIFTFLITNLVFNFNLIESFIAIILILILSTPYALRLSRMIWINLFVSFSGKKNN